MSDGSWVEEELTQADSAKILKGKEFEVLSRARAGVESAENDAAEIIAQARADAERIRAKAFKKGQRDAAAFAVEHALRTARDLDSLEPRLTQIVIDALRMILDPIPAEELVVAAVRRAAADVDMERGATLIVSPERMAGIREHLAAHPIGSSALELHGDPECPLDSTILRTRYGDIELDVESQLAALAEGIEAALTEGAR